MVTCFHGFYWRWWWRHFLFLHFLLRDELLKLLLRYHIHGLKLLKILLQYWKISAGLEIVFFLSYGPLQNGIFIVITWHKQKYCIWILTRNYGINYMNQCITKMVLHVYSKTQDSFSIVITRHSNQPPKIQQTV